MNISNNIQGFKELERKAKLLGYARRLEAVDTIQDPKEKETVLLCRKGFQKIVEERYSGEKDKDSLTSYLIFVANLEYYTIEERIQMNRELQKEMTEEITAYQKTQSERK